MEQRRLASWPMSKTWVSTEKLYYLRAQRKDSRPTTREWTTLQIRPKLSLNMYPAKRDLTQPTVLQEQNMHALKNSFLATSVRCTQLTRTNLKNNEH
jgi:hypothetical protein